MQPGDVYQTYADVDDLVRISLVPDTVLEEGLSVLLNGIRITIRSVRRG